jgi:acid stress-induced BolA-like protein IbaG/YrbA
VFIVIRVGGFFKEKSKIKNQKMIFDLNLNEK